MTAAAQDIEGVYNNAAAPAVRAPFSLNYIDIEPSVGISLPGAYGRTDFSNRGEKGSADTIGRTNRFLSYNAGIQVQVGNLGATVMGDFLNYTVNSREGAPVSLTLGRIHAVLAYGFLDNQVAIGAGARIIFVDVHAQQGAGALRMVGAAPQVGAIVKPNGVPWRLGVTGRAPVEASPFSLLSTQNAPTATGKYVPPDTITEPWELEAGVAYQLGPRPLNPSWINPHDEEREELELRPDEASNLSGLRRRLKAERRARYLNWPREHLLMLASVVLTGPSTKAVALEGFIDQRLEYVGQRLSVSPRFAVEAEPIANHVRGRAGLYFEPSRFLDGTHRQHFTFGTDVRLFAWDVFGLSPDTIWRISGFLDLAPRYQDFGFAIGPWH